MIWTKEHPEDPNVPSVLRAIENTIADYKPTRGEMRVCFSDGE